MTTPIQQAQKQCPQCGAMQDINLAQCFRCNHVFRTQFQQPPNQTQAFPAGVLPTYGRQPRRMTSVAAWLGVATLIGVLAFVALKVFLKPAIAGEWILADSPLASTSKMVIRPDGTGEIFWNMNPSTNQPTGGLSRPFKWHIEGSLFFFEPLNPDQGTVPQMNAYKLFDSNRYLTLTVDNKESTWRRAEN